MPAKDCRIVSIVPELRARGENQLPTIVGYAAVFYRDGDKSTEYQLWTDTVERVSPGAFDRAVREDDVVALFDHWGTPLGRTKDTLRLQVDERGLRYEIDPPDTAHGREVVAAVQRSDVRGSSFSFSVRSESWTKQRIGDRDLHVRVLLDVTLRDVGPVVFPAYSGTSAGVRSDKDWAEARSAFDEENRKTELMKAAEAEAFRLKMAKARARFLDLCA